MVALWLRAWSHAIDDAPEQNDVRRERLRILKERFRRPPQSEPHQDDVAGPVGGEHMPEPEIAHGVDDSRGSRHHQENDDQPVFYVE
jgi:hypothetical protein